MATIASGRVADAVRAELWEIPQEKPLFLRLVRPWLKNPVGLLGLIIVIGFFVLGILGPYIRPYDPTALDASSRLLGPSLEHPFGTTRFGQDLFSRVVQGTRLSMNFGAAVLIFGFLPGTLLGILSGYFGRWVDYAIQRSGEAWAAIPQLPLLLTIIAAMGPGLDAAVVVLAISSLFGGSRLMRAVALVEKNKEHMIAARATGASELRLLVRHVIPNVMPYILVGASSVFAIAVLAEATLSFLGVGVEQGTPGWGIDLSVGLRGDGTSYPHLVIFPGLAISLVVLGFNLMGDTLRDILDPRLRGSQ
jgi:ABC-type dipeptide/oligopeptide/nickel transport system permease subunit